MKIKLFIFLSILSFFCFQEVNAAKKPVQKYVMKPCEYSARSISKPTLAGIRLTKGVNFSVVSQVGSILAGNTSSVPLDFILNLDVLNRNPDKVSLLEFEYVLMIDRIEFTRGTFKKKVSIPAGKSKIVSLPLSFDLATILMRNSSANAAQNLVRNFMRTGNRETFVTLQIRPVYKVKNQTIANPRYSSVSFSFGGK